MNQSIAVLKKSLPIVIIVALLFLGVSWAFANNDPPIVHSCVNSSSGTIKIVQGPDECTGNEDSVAIVTETGLLDILTSLAGLQTALDEEIVARMNTS